MHIELDFKRNILKCQEVPVSKTSLKLKNGATFAGAIPALGPAAAQHGITLGRVQLVAVAGLRDETQAGDAILVTPLPAVEALDQPETERQLPHAALSGRGGAREQPCLLYTSPSPRD